MKGLLNQKDLGLLSAYLDGCLSQTQKDSFETRLQSEPDLKRAYEEFLHTRTLLRSLTPRHAPRNFTLSNEYARIKPKSQILPLLFGWTSGAAAVALAAVFVFAFLLPARSTSMLMAAPAAAPMNEAALDAAATGTPMIITWNSPNYAYGRGGGGYGGGDGSVEVPKAAEPNTMAAGGGGMPVAGTEAPAALPAPMTQSPTQSPGEAAAADESVNPSTLILGLPQPGTQGTEIAHIPAQSSTRGISLSPRSIWMIALGFLTVLLAALAIFFRKR